MIEIILYLTINKSSCRFGDYLSLLTLGNRTLYQLHFKENDSFLFNPVYETLKTL